VEPKIDSLRRESDTELKSFTVSLPVKTVELLEKYGIKSGRGGGNLSCFCEIAMETILGIFDNPKLAADSILRVLDFNDIAHYELAQNLEEVSKRLLDSLE
jgi:hypothetical protein